MLEYDFDNPAHRRRHRRPPPILEGEILTPESEPRIHRVDIRHHRNGHIPQMIIAGALLFLVLRFLPYFGIGLLIAVALLIAYPIVGIVAGVTVAALVIIATLERRAGRPF